LQPTQIILVQDPELKQELSAAAMVGPGNQYRTADCSVLAVFLADLRASERIQRIYELEQEWGQRAPAYMAMMPLSASFLLGEGVAATWVKQVATSVLRHKNNRNTTSSINSSNNANGSAQPLPMPESIDSWSAKNTALFAQSYVLAATSHNLATCIMEGFDADIAKEILRVPDRYSIPMMVATGYEYEEEEENSRTPRLDLSEFVFADTFGESFLEEEVMERDTAASA
jgi:nitroreductase